jgi:hypothetical protein
MSENQTIDVGARVRLKPEKAESYLLPYRKFAIDGRLGTVTIINSFNIRIDFDVKRKGAKPVVGWCQPSRFFLEYEIVEGGRHE